MSRAYVLQFEQLSLGEHSFTFEVDKDVFIKRDVDEVLDADFTIDLRLYKTGNMMDMRFNYNGKFTLTCDRCTDPMEMSIEDETKLAVKFGQEHHEDLDELIVLEDHEHEIDLEQYFYECLSLMIPVRHVHEEKDCNQEILKRLGNIIQEDESDGDEIDPRWQKLKEL